MDLNIITGIVGIISIVGAITTILTYFERLRSKREQQNQEKIEQQMKPLREKVEIHTIDLKKISKAILQINNLCEARGNKLCDISEELKEQTISIRQNDFNNLQGIVVDYATKVRNGCKIDKNSFDYICQCYDRYKTMGGNSYIDNEFDYIREAYNNLGDNKNENTM